VFRRRSSLSRSKRGFIAALLGALILLGLLLYGLAPILGRLKKPVVDYLGPIVVFFGTGPGVLLSVTLAVLLILWALRTRQPESKPSSAGSSSRVDRERQRLESALQEGKLHRKRLKLAQHEGEREREQLRAELREGERERERLRAELRTSERERERLESELRASVRELERLKASLQENLQEHERERESLKSEIEQLRAERYTLEEKLTTYDSRVALKQALNAAYWDGLHLRRRTPSHRRGTGRGRGPNDEAAAKWAIRTSELIKEALGEGEARRFLGVYSSGSGEPSATERQEQLDERLKWLAELIQRVDSFEPLELQAGFQVQERLKSG
jgi:chromosome segregation ATPase